MEHHGLKDHGFPYRLAVSPGGEWLAAGLDSGIRLWSLATYKEGPFFPVPTERVLVVAFSPDGRRIAAAGLGPDVFLIDWPKGKLAAVLRGHTATVHALAFSRDGSQLVSAGMDATVRLWNVGEGRLIRTMPGHSEQVFAAVFHPDGSRIASAGRDRAVRIWDTATGAEVAPLQGHSKYVFSLAFSPDGRTLASGSGDKTIRLWDTFPVARRQEALREERDNRSAADQLVHRLLKETGDPAKVAEKLRTDPGLSDALRRAAGHALLRAGTVGR
jgi:WD40 repeat protein